MQLILISGLSGSGKSVALRVLEDCNFYCIDNLPERLLPEIVTYLQEIKCLKGAISIDIRGNKNLKTIKDRVNLLKKIYDDLNLQILFLDASNDTLIRRFSETRRRHPLSQLSIDEFETIQNSEYLITLPECLNLERELLMPLSEISFRIDTTSFSAKQLRQEIKDFATLGHDQELILCFQSFAFKHNVPNDSDFTFDVRCLPNPYYDITLRSQTGLDKGVIDFLSQQSNVQAMREDITQYLEKWLPDFIADNRTYVTVGIGCTGGQHRSVYLTEQLANHFRRYYPNYKVLTRHRMLSKNNFYHSHGL